MEGQICTKITNFDVFLVSMPHIALTRKVKLEMGEPTTGALPHAKFHFCWWKFGTLPI